GVGLGLVLEEQVEKCPDFALLHLHRVEQVGLALAQRLVDEARFAQRQAGPVQAFAQRGGQVLAQKERRLLGVGEDGAKELVVGVLDKVAHASILPSRRAGVEQIAPAAGTIVSGERNWPSAGSYQRAP